MIRGILLICLLMLPEALQAQTVRVSSGDHAGFSRLLLHFDAGGDWEFGKVSGGYEFRPSSRVGSYELGSVFDLISRDRIAQVSDRGDGRLFLKVDCDCHGDAFDLRGGQVVLDIKDGPAPNPASAFERTLAQLPGSDEPLPAIPAPPPRPPHIGASAAAAVIADRAGLPLLSPRGPGPLEGWSIHGGPQPPLFVQPQTAAPSDEPMPASDPPAQDTLIPSPRIAEAESALLAQISRAAAQGLLEANLDELERDVNLATTPVSRRTVEIPAAPPEKPKGLLPPEEIQAHLSVETAVDRAAAADMGAGANTDDGRPCLDPKYFDIAAWGGPGEPSGDDLGLYRGRILGEFDIANGEGVTRLARHYLYMTFGAEAKALIGRHSDDVVRGDLLTIMADVMDTGQSEHAEMLVDQMACAGPTALWAVLAQPRLSATQTINTEGIALSFSALPLHLRRHLGPGLAEKFLDIGEISKAENIRNAIARGGDAPTGRAEALSARIDLETGDPKAAGDRLEAVIQADDEALGPALLRRIELALSNGEAPSPEQIGLLESLAFERRSSPDAAPFLAAAARAHAMASDFSAAFGRIAEFGHVPGVEPAAVDDLTGEVLLRLGDNAAADTFLKLALPRLDFATGLAAAERHRIAERFLDLGFPAPARRLLGASAEMPTAGDRVLFAKAAVLEEHPEIAIGYLAGLESEDALRTRAEALERAGDYAGALRAYGALGDVGAESSVAWRGGLWEELSQIADGPMQEAARLMAHMDDPPSTNELAPLARAGALVDQSRFARTLITDLLRTIEPPPPAEEL